MPALSACCVQVLLQVCGRAHSLPQVYMALDALAAASPPSWSLDLISGLPGLTVEGWGHSLREAVRAQPHHISIYDLQVRARHSLLLPSRSALMLRAQGPPPLASGGGGHAVQPVAR